MREALIDPENKFQQPTVTILAKVTNVLGHMTGTHVTGAELTVGDAVVKETPSLLSRKL